MYLYGYGEVPLWHIGTALTVILIIYLIYSFVKDTKAHRVWKHIGLPQATPLPFLGSIMDLKRKGFAQYDMECLKKYGKIYGSYWGPYPQLHIADPELVKEVLVKRFSEFQCRISGDPGIKELQGSLTMTFGDHWRFMRSILSPTFSSGKMRMMNPHINDCCEQLVANMREMSETPGGRSEVRGLFSSYTMDVITRTAFGIEVNSQKDPDNEFVKHAKSAAGQDEFLSVWSIIRTVIPILGPLLNVLTRLTNKKPVILQHYYFFKDVTMSLIQSRKTNDQEKRQDFLQLMLNAHDEDSKEKIRDTSGNVLQQMANANKDTENKDDKETKLRALTTGEITANAYSFFLAGYHTTASTLTFLAYNLAVNSECQSKCIEEVDRVLGSDKPSYDNLLKLEYLDNCVNETLRLHGPAIRTNRMTFTETDVGGYKIPKYVVMNIHIYAIHHDPEYWPDPYKFDPDRFLPENSANRHPYAFLPFGKGPRHCIGMRLAYMEIKAVIASILQNFRLVRCDQTEVPVKLSGKSLLIEKNKIIVKIEPRAS